MKKYIDELKYYKKLATSPMNPTYDEILKANSLRGNKIKKTPLIHSSTFSDLYMSSSAPSNKTSIGFSNVCSPTFCCLPSGIF